MLWKVQVSTELERSQDFLIRKLHPVNVLIALGLVPELFNKSEQSLLVVVYAFLINESKQQDGLNLTSSLCLLAT